MKKSIYIALIILIIGTGWALVSNKPSNNQNEKNVSTSQKIINTGGQLIDVRTVQEYTEKHADKAVNIPLDNILAGNYDGIAKDTPLFLYCRSGNRSDQAKTALEKAGYKNITDLGALSSLESDGMIVCKGNNPNCQ